MKRSNTSAGLLIFRERYGSLEVLLVHPGGPFWKNKDDGAWTIPKGEVGDEDLLARAITEFEEELGFAAEAETWIDLGTVKQKGGKMVHAWAGAGDLPPDFTVRSNTFEMQWPPRSGRKQAFPEIDRAQFFPLAEAEQKINPAQVIFLERLSEISKQSWDRSSD
jgi:predicted NUDIX family NTP pyrophosphohydrolase